MRVTHDARYLEKTALTSSSLAKSPRSISARASSRSARQLRRGEGNPQPLLIGRANVVLGAGVEAVGDAEGGIAQERAKRQSRALLA